MTRVAMLGISVAAFLAWLAAAGPAMAEPALSPVLAKIIATPEHRKAVVDAAQQSSVWLNNRCPDARFAVGADVAVYQPVELDAQSRPVAGSWRERVAATGCGTSRTLNVLTYVKSAGRLVSGALLPGATLADPLLQRDAFHYALLAAVPPANCNRVYVADTVFLGAEGTANAGLPPGRRVPPWKEAWTVAACDRRSLVTLHFAPDATGTNITTNSAETRPAQ